MGPMSLPIAVAQAAEQALLALAPQAVAPALAILQRLGTPIPAEAVPVIQRLVEQIASSPTPLDTAKRALLATASSEATDAALAQLLK
jgi:hypothetical protein